MHHRRRGLDRRAEPALAESRRSDNGRRPAGPIRERAALADDRAVLAERRVPLHSGVADVSDAARVTGVLSRIDPRDRLARGGTQACAADGEQRLGGGPSNVGGTRVIRGRLARRVERFILISTDKAVNPSSVMGATKRAAELRRQGWAHGTAPASCRALRQCAGATAASSQVPRPDRSWRPSDRHASRDHAPVLILGPRTSSCRRRRS